MQVSCFAGLWVCFVLFVCGFVVLMVCGLDPLLVCGFVGFCGFWVAWWDALWVRSACVCAPVRLRVRVSMYCVLSVMFCVSCVVCCVLCVVVAGCQWDKNVAKSKITSPIFQTCGKFDARVVFGHVARRSRRGRFHAAAGQQLGN